MQRITAVNVPYILAFHTSARDFLKSSIVNGISVIPDRTLVLNYADYVKGCKDLDIYSCCLEGYTPQDFVKASYYMENSVCGSHSEEYYSYFLKTLRLFGIEIASLAGYLNYLKEDQALEGVQFKVIPTLPSKLVQYLKDKRLVSPTIYTQGTAPSASDWLQVIGYVTLHYSFTGDIDWFKYIGPSNYSTNLYSAYIFDLLRSLTKDTLDEFLLYKEGCP